MSQEESAIPFDSEALDEPSRMALPFSVQNSLKINISFNDKKDMRGNVGFLGRRNFHIKIQTTTFHSGDNFFYLILINKILIFKDF